MGWIDYMHILFFGLKVCVQRKTINLCYTIYL